MGFPGHDLLLWQDPIGFLQGEAEDLAQETAAITGTVHRLDTKVSQLAAHRGTAPKGQGTRERTLELLRDYRQLR